MHDKIVAIEEYPHNRDMDDNDSSILPKKSASVLSGFSNLEPILLNVNDGGCNENEGLLMVRFVN